MTGAFLLTFNDYSLFLYHPNSIVLTVICNIIQLLGSESSLFVICRNSNSVALTKVSCLQHNESALQSH